MRTIVPVVHLLQQNIADAAFKCAVVICCINNNQMDKFMKINRYIPFPKIVKYSVAGLFTLTLVACGSSSDDSNATGNIKFYNASKNAPAIYLTLDENIDTDEDDEIEITFSSIEYGSALNNYEILTNDYTIELAWQDEDSSERSELEMIYQSQLTIAEDVLHFVVLTNDVTTPEVTVYDIPVIDDEDDDSYERFNLRLLNLHSVDSAVDVYMSKSDETFNEAVLAGSFSYQSLSDNQKYDQGSYVFYITNAGEQEVLFQSSAIDYYYSSQYVMVIRENSGTGSSPYVIDKLTNSSSTEYIDLNAEAEFSLYNGVALSELLPTYQSNLSLFIDTVDEAPEVDSLAYGELSTAVTLANGDYSFNLLSSESKESLLSNHLLSLPENANKTVFIYADEIDVDDDNDGDVDEDGDGIVDEKEINIHSLVIDNSLRESIYDHEIKMVNLVDSDDFNSVSFYFVRADETIDTADYSRSMGFADHQDIFLKNNTYQVYVVAKENSSDIILSSFELVLDEQSHEQFLVIEKSTASATGYKTSKLNQGAE